MGAAVRDWKVTGYEPLIKALELPDHEDRHVLAAAIRARAQVIVTFRLRDFPAAQLEPWDLEAKHPDAFVEAQIDLDPPLVYAAVRQIADSWLRPPGTVNDVLRRHVPHQLRHPEPHCLHRFLVPAERLHHPGDLGPPRAHLLRFHRQGPRAVGPTFRSSFGSCPCHPQRRHVAESARAQGVCGARWYSDVIPAGYEQFIAFEDAAETVAEYQLGLSPACCSLGDFDNL